MFSKNNFKTQLLYGLILSLIFGITITTFFSIQSLVSISEQAAHSYLMIGRGNELEGLIYKSRHASRGFFLAGDESYVARYEHSKVEVAKFIAATKQLIGDNLSQKALLDEVQALMEKLYEYNKVGIEHKRNLITNRKLVQQKAVQQIDIFAEVKALLNQLQLTMIQQKNDEIGALLTNILATLFECEISQKNFLFTNEEKFLDLYDANLVELETKIHMLKQHFAAENELSKQVNTLSALLGKSKDLLDKQELKDYTPQVLELGGNADATFRESLLKSEETMMSISQKLNDFTATERMLSSNRDQEMRTVAVVLQSVSIFGNLLIIFLGVIAIVSFNRQDWLKNGYAALNEKMKGEQDVTLLTKNIISFVSCYLGVKVGLFYLLKTPEQPDHKPYLQLISSYAYTPCESIPNKFLVGEGLIGEVALECKPLFHSSHESKEVVQSTLVQSKLRHVLFVPVLFENALIGIFELGLVRHLKKIEQQFLEGITQHIGIALNTSIARSKMSELLAYSQKQEKELLIQKDELQHINGELQAQSEELQSQEEELRQYNDELEQRMHELEEQREQIREKNQALEKAKSEVEIKAQALETASKYKSEFLANMSHELRTPLNSILMLAQILLKNNDGNLTTKQIEQAQTIYQSGTDLLTLINDVLDLSKVEAGKMDIHLEEVPLSDLVENVRRKFIHVAEGKGLLFKTIIAENVPRTIHTDAQRLNQIVTNLISNAIKFTAHGTVQFIIEFPLEKEVIISGTPPEHIIALRVIDSGIGVPKEKQQLIFEAFQQADGSTSRHYGGTGLGLSISRELARLLGGKLGIISEEGKGSTFTLYLPASFKSEKNQEGILPLPAAISNNTAVVDTTAESDNKHLVGKKVLIVDDDQRNAFVLTLALDNVGMTTLSCSSGREALLFLEKNPDTNVVLMDIMMPGISGYETIRKIREQSRFGKLPIIVVTAKTMIGDRQKCIEAGANDYLTKPVNNEQLLSVLKVWLS